VRLVTEALQHRARLAPQTEVRVVGLIRRFGAFVERAFDITSLEAITASHVAAFTNARTAEGIPSVATTRLRRWAVRLFFRVACDLGLTATDPTLDVLLPPRTNRSARPLSTDEVERCRRAALHDLSSTRLSVVWALGEASARTAEIPRIRIADLDMAHAQVRIPGSSQTTPRYGTLTSWGVDQLGRRMREVGRDAPSDVSIAHVGRGNAESRVSFSAQGIRETLVRSGLGDAADVHPMSLTAWCGVQVFEATRRIEAVARALGVRSLDTAAQIIRWEWQNLTGAAPDG
jgi:integrase/recombinase XerC